MMFFKEIKNKITKLINDNKNIFSISYNQIPKLKRSIPGFFYNWEQNYYRIFLFIFIAIGFFIRFSYIRNGLPYLHYWDEPHITAKAIEMLQDGDFNPHFFNYPPLTAYLLLPFYILNYFQLMGNGRLAGLDEIIIGRDTGWVFHGNTGWLWTISHPSFYAVGRLLMVLLSILSILLVYEVGKRYFNRKIGLIAAVILTFSDFGGSSINLNIPVLFFVLLTLFLLSLYIEKKHIKYIILTGLSVGLAAAAKYNSFLIIVPAILGVLFFSNKRIRDLLIVIFSTGLGFFIGCPYALLDLNTFLDHAGFEVRHYKVFGHDGAQGIPGMTQLKFYLSYFRNWINNTFSYSKSWILSLAGVAVLPILDIKKVLIVFSFPILYVLYMSQQKVNFTRNMLCITPFIVLTIAIALYYGYRILVEILNIVGRRKHPFKINKNIIFIVCLLLVLFISFKPVKVINNAYDFITTYKESRTQAVEYIRDNFPDAKIGISEELRMHQLDLDKIPDEQLFNTEEASLIKLYEEGFDYIISSERYSYFGNVQREQNADKLKIIENKFPSSNIIKFFGSGHVGLDIYSAEPKVNIYEVNDVFLSEKYNTIKEVQDGNISLNSLSSDIKEIFKDDEISMMAECFVETGFFKYNKGSYELSFLARGTVAGTQWPILELDLLSLEDNSISEFGSRELKEIGKEDYNWYSFCFNLERDYILALKLSFINDYFNEVEREDRNIFIKEVRLESIDKNSF